MASGFSTMTCLPAFRAFVAKAKCSRFGVAMWTASTFGSASTSSTLLYAFGRPRAFLAFFDSASSTPQMPLISTPSRLSASTCTGPMKPAPMTATPMLCMFDDLP